MSSINIGSWTLENDREWRAWSTPVRTDTPKTGDQFRAQSCLHIIGSGPGLWTDLTPETHSWGFQCHFHDYRRPVPLPSLDPELVNACQLDGQYSWKIDWIFTNERERCVMHLRTLLPGYEEQLAKVKEPPHQYADPQTGEPRGAVLVCPDCDLRYHDTTDVSHCDCGHRIDQMVSEYARSALKQPSPVPADGCFRDRLGQRVRDVWVAWAERQPNPKPSWLVPWEDLAETDREADRCIGAALWGDFMAEHADLIALKELPPPPQEKGGEA